MLKTILVPLDGSALAEAAPGYAAELSIPTGARLLLVRVAYSHALPGVDPRERKQGAIWEAEQYLTRTASSLIERGYVCEAVVPYGDAADCIVEQARMSKTDLIVMSTHGRTGPGHLVFGSVAEAVVSRSAVPVLVTRAWWAPDPAELLKESPLFMVPLDGSKFAETATEPAVQLADDFGSVLLLVTAQPPDAAPVEGIDYLTQIESRVRQVYPELSIEVEFRYGDPAHAIDEVHREGGASLIVKATHGRSGVLRSMTGSVAGKVLKEGRAPVVLIRPPAYVEEIANQTDEISGCPGSAATQVAVSVNSQIDARIEIVMAVLRCGDRICLARRSQLVATSRGLWSVVTGYLEPATEPLAQAWSEMDEELGLRPPKVRVVRRLEPVPLSSPGSGKQFLVHPFLFECDSAEPLVLNWENDEATWCELSALDRPDCVSWQLDLVRALLDGVTEERAL